MKYGQRKEQEDEEDKKEESSFQRDNISRSEHGLRISEMRL